MRFRIAIATCTFLLGTSSVCFAQVKLEHKFNEGTSHTKEITSKIDQKLTILGMDTELKVDNRSIVKTSSGKRDDKGTLRVQQKVELLQISIDTMGKNYVFDSTKPDNTTDSPIESLRPVHKALAQRITTLVVDKNNRIEAVESDQNLLDMLPADVQQLVKSQIDPENAKKAANEELDQLPKNPVKTGDTWEHTESANFGAGQVMAFQMKYTYAGTVEKDGKKLDKITAQVTSVDFSLQDSPLMLMLKSSNLKATESETTSLFDREAGYVVESKTIIRITGDIVFVAGGMELPSKLDLKMETTSTTR